MAEQVFKSIWGDMTFPGEKVIEKAPDPVVKPAVVIDEKAPIVKEGEDEEEVIVPTITPKAEPPATPPAGGEGGEPEPIELSEDEVSKTYTFLLDEGVLEDLGEEADFDASGKGLADAIAATVRVKLQKELDAIPPVVQEFYTHVIGGNSPTTFTPTVAASWSSFDTSTDEGKRVALRAFLKMQGTPEEDIEDEINDVEINNKLERKADIAIRALEKREQDDEAAKATARKKTEEEAIKQAQKEADELVTFIDTTQEIAGFKLDDDKRKKFKDYLFKKNPRTGLTQLQENMSSQERKLQIAFLDFANYNQADLEKTIASNLTKERKMKLSRYSRGAVANKAVQSVKTGTDKQGGKVTFPTIFGTQKIEIED